MYQTVTLNPGDDNSLSNGSEIMDDQDQNVTGMDGTPPEDQGGEGEGVPIPARLRDAVSEVRQRIRDDAQRGRDVVREYEERYRGGRSRLETPPGEQEDSPARVPMPGKHKWKHDPASVDDNERKWAMLAHLSTLLTALVALFSGGLGVLITMLVPLLIYFSFRKRSEYVAFHALQAFTVQLVGTIGWLALVTVGFIVWVLLIIISALLILLLVGIILLPLVVLTGLLMFVLSLALPLGMVIFSVIAAVETHAGRNYRIPYIARWAENQMYGGFIALF
jgi:uncharacterized protein